MQRESDYESETAKKGPRLFEFSRQRTQTNDVLRHQVTLFYPGRHRSRTIVTTVKLQLDRTTNSSTSLTSHI
jgi:hypothetical protein